MHDIRWSQKHMARIKLNQFLSKHLLKAVATGDVNIELTYGARLELEPRVRELLPNTLKLIALSHCEDLIKLTINVMPKDVLVDMMTDPDGTRFMIELADDRLIELKAEILASFQKMVDGYVKKRKENMVIYNDHTDKFFHKIVELFYQEVYDQAKDIPELIELMVMSNHCTADQMFYLIEKHPTALRNALRSSGPLEDMLEQGCFKLARTGKEFNSKEE